MGDVYRATDTRLGRTVAIKLLKPAHADRFQREALAIAALNHPHICTLYDAGPDYLVMEYVDGVPVHGPIAPAEAVRLGLQIAAALEAAHARGIVHRDLKPANVLVTASGVKLLDFGIAKMAGPATGEGEVTTAETRAGTILGTAAYMSPEQASGGTADARSDVFAFGAVLYEMLSGHQAFRGATPAAVIAAVLRDEPATIDAPADLRAVVARCLRKEPAERFQSMGEVARALERAAVARDTASAGSSIAVLPFANLSGDKENEYFSDGLAEEILNALTRVPHLKVTARTSSFAFRGREQDIRKIAETLDVRTILEGSVRRAGTRIRVAAQLIDASNGYHLWSERYDRELTDVFEVQDEIAAAIAGALRLTLAGGSAQAPRYMPSFPAYEAFLQGRHFFARQTADDLPRAIACHQRAVALDPGYPDPHVELGAAYMVLWYFGLKPARAMVPLILSEVRQAREAEPATPRANGLLGIVAAAYDYDWTESRRLLELALTERVGTEAEARWCYATFHLAPEGRFDEGLALFAQMVQEGDPLNVVWRGSTAQYLNLAGRHDEALERLHALHEIDRGYWISHLYMAESYAASGRWNEARVSAEEAYRLAPWSARVIGSLAAAFKRTGDPAGAAALTARLESGGEPHWGPAGMVLYHALLGEVDGMADWYARAIEQRDVWVVIQSAGWLTRELRASPLWPALARQMNRPGAVASSVER